MSNQELCILLESLLALLESDNVKAAKKVIKSGIRRIDKDSALKKEKASGKGTDVNS